MLLIILILVFWKFFIPGPRVANDFPYVYPESLKIGFSIPPTWQIIGGEGMGENGILTMWSWPNNLVFGLLGILSFSFEIVERIFLLLSLILGVISIYKLLIKYQIGRSGIFIATLFYLTTTYFVLLIDGGQLKIALAYTFLPLTFVLFEEAYRSSLKSKLFAGLGMFILGFLDIRFVYVLLILLFLRFLYKLFLISRSKVAYWFLEWIYVMGMSTIIFLGLNSYWILPMLLVRTESISANFNRLTETSFLSFATWKHALLMLQPHWYKNVFGKISAVRDYKEFLLIPLLVFSAPLVVYLNKSKERFQKLRVVFFWLFVAIISVFLVKGSNPPFVQVYPWLFENIPGFSLFRDSTKFYFLVSLSYAVLIGFTTDGIIKLTQDLKMSRTFLKSYILNPRSLVLFLTTYILLLARPVWSGQMTGTLSDPVYEEEFFNIADILKQDRDFGRVLWIPSRPPLGFASPVHPAAEALRLVDKRPFAIGTVGSYELFNYLREASFMGELMEIAGVKYIVYPYPDTRREELKQDNIDYYNVFLDQLSNLPWIEGMVSSPPVSVLKTKKDVEHFYLAENTFIIVGSDRIYDELVGIERFDLSQNAILFAEAAPEATIASLGNPNTKIILFEKDNLDFLMSTITEDKFIFPAKYLGPDPDENGWWKRDTEDFLWWRNFLQEKYDLDYQDFDYGGGWAVGEGYRELVIRNEKLHSGDMVFARVMNSKSGGVLEFKQGENKLNGPIGTNGECSEKTYIKLTGYKEIPDKFFEYDCAFLFWLYIGKIDKDGEISIKTKGDLNVINALVSIPEGELNNFRDKINHYEVYNWNDLDDEKRRDLFRGFLDSNPNDSLFFNDKPPGLKYTRISPTHYKVSIKGLESPATLVFSESYDSLWQIEYVQTGEKENSYPLYGLINGFYIEKDGEYDVYFLPQKYVYPGMVGSGITLFLIGFTFIFRRRIKY